MKPYLLALAALSAHAAQLSRGAGAINGVGYRFETQLEPGTPGISHTGGGTLTDDRLAQRHICLFEQKTYFGYDLRFEPTAGGRVRMLLAPLSMTPAKIGEIMKKGPWTALPVPAMPGPQVVEIGDEVVFDLFVNGQTGQRIVEHIWIESATPALPQQVAASAPELKPSDVWMTLGKLKVALNNQVAEVGSGGKVSGNQVWFALPDRGRYFLSLVPRDGFTRAGSVTPRTLAFRIGGDSLGVATAERIIPADGTFALFVRHDPNYRGTYPLGAQ